MNYDDMPVGTVLRNADGDIAFKTTNLHRPWFLVFTDGERDHERRPQGDGWVEMVAKPAALIDGEGCRWEPHTEPVYRVQTGFSEWLTRAQIEADWPPVNEVPE